MSEKYIAVKIESDGDGHKFIIPNDLADDFSDAMEKGYMEDDWDDAEKFQKYGTGGCVNNYQLYITEAEMKKLTGGK